MRLAEKFSNFLARRRAYAKKRVVDDSHMRQIPERRPLHWVYTLLFGVALVSVMWKHCHPTLTAFLLFLLIPFSLPAYLPYRVFSYANRFILQLLLLAGGVVWAFLRLKNAPVFDIAAVESLAIVASSFLMCRRGSDYGFLFLLSIFFFIYGALLTRVMFLFTFGIGVVLILFLLYRMRTINLSSDSEAAIPPVRLRRTWFYFAFHLLLCMIGFWFIFTMIPMSESKTKGMFEVSFMTDKDSMLNPEMQSFLNRSGKVKKGKWGPSMLKGGDPDTMDMSGTPMNIPKSRSKSLAEGEGGSSSMGQDLVFRVKSPLKLYHLAQLYDSYDGRTWTASKNMKNMSIRKIRDYRKIPRGIDVELKYSIQKWISSRIFAPFYPLSFTPESSLSNMAISHSQFYGAQVVFRDGGVSVPFRYKAVSRITIPEKDMKSPEMFEPPPGEKIPPAPAGKREKKEPPVQMDYWQERIPKSFYLRLPRKKISERVRKLAETVVGDAKTPYEKAVRLRDYLRTHYPYRLEARPTPKNKESADYFLFEQREGHCEYFATALCVMARSVHLPARIAVGFSPGNYNTMDNSFEVYEYHAHAWTQIFIEDMGWLTFDATPPSAVPSRTTPLGIGSLRDPFGDEWRVMPPEITSRTRDFVRNVWLEQYAERRKKNEESSAAKILEKAAQTKDDLQKKIFRAYGKKKAVDVKKALPENAPRKWYTPFLDFFRNFNVNFQSLMFSLQKFFIAKWKLLPPLTFLLLSGGIMFRIFLIYWKQRRIQRKAAKHFLLAESPETDPDSKIRHVFSAVLLLLKLANFPRRKNVELLSYAESLRKEDPELSNRAARVFRVFYSVEYGGLIPDAFAIQVALEDASEVRRIVYGRIRKNEPEKKEK